MERSRCFASQTAFLVSDIAFFSYPVFLRNQPSSDPKIAGQSHSVGSWVGKDTATFSPTLLCANFVLKATINTELS